MFATSFASYPLTFRYAGLGEAPEGQADVLDVAGPANFSARFVVQRANRIYYSDFRTVNGREMAVPH